MSAAKNRKKRHARKLTDLKVMRPNAAGIDIGSFEHWVAIRPDADNQPIRCFQGFTSDLKAMADWLTENGVDTIAMESTGVYWIPVYQILEARGFEVYLVNSRHTKNVSGRKDDSTDSDWIRQLHAFGLLSASFQPEAHIRELRAYLRHREMLISYAASHIQHMQKALTQMNLHLHHVISDISGKTGMQILRAMVDGERDPKVLATYRDKRVKADEETIAKALEGNYRDEHMFPLKQNLELYDFYQRRIEVCDRRIETLLQAFPTVEEIEDRMPADTPKPKGRRKKKSANAPKFDTESYLRRITGVDLFAVDGFSDATLLGIISEVGTDMGPWKTQNHFTSWLRLAPNNKISGGKVLSRRTEKTNNRANNLFRLSAQSLANSDCQLGAFYRRKRYQLGSAKAIVATARKLACLFYKMMKYKVEYQKVSSDQYNEQFKARQIKNLQKRAQALGFKVVEGDD